MFSAGVVDEDYRGNVGVVLFNHSDAAFEVKQGDRIAQFICERILIPEVEEVKVRYYWYCQVTPPAYSSFYYVY